MLILWMRWDVCGLRQRGISAWCILAWNERDQARGNGEKREKNREDKRKKMRFLLYYRPTFNYSERTCQPKDRAHNSENSATRTTLKERRYRNLLLSVGAGDGVSVELERGNGRGTCERTYFAAVEPEHAWHFISILIRAQFGISFHLLEVFLGNIVLHWSTAAASVATIATFASLCLSLIFIFNFEIFTLISG